MDTFESVDNHINSLGALPPIDPSKVSAQLCTYYKAAKPILVLVMTLPFFPTKWKTVLTGFVGLLDVICP